MILSIFYLYKIESQGGYMEFKKTKIEGHMADVVSLKQLQNNRDIYSTGNTAVEVAKADGELFILPYRPDASLRNRPGVYPFKDGSGDFIVYPVTPEGKEAYKPEVIDLANAKSMQDYISKQGRLHEIEKEILTTPDNIFRPHISDEDSPLMRGLKQAIIQKHIDIDKYADGYGTNFPNDKRKLKDTDISIRLAERHFDILGIKAELILSDASPDVANPIGNPIHIPLTYDGNDIDDESGGNDG